jgi:hypothetical protein
MMVVAFMRNMTRGILRVLDGAPRPANRGAQVGQSLVEMAFIIPLLAIMVVGIVEIGWYANHFLIMLEVTRVGARAGTTLSGDLSPAAWNELASVHPVVHVNGLGRLPADVPVEATNSRNCDLVSSDPNVRGFYNFIACTMVNSLLPLTLAPITQTNGLNPYDLSKPGKNIFDRYGNLIETIPYPDDIVISAFSLQAINNAPRTSVNPPAQAVDPRGFQLATSLYSRTYDFEADPLTTGRYPLGSQVIVVGRYPKAANECNVFEDSAGVRTIVAGQDPFDYFPDGVLTQRSINPSIPNRPVELVGYDPPDPEAQLGFVWMAQHQRDLESGSLRGICWGSNFDIPEIETLMNLPNFVEPPRTGIQPWTQERAALPSQGLVVVEMFWQHNILLDFPFVQPIIAFFGDTNNIVISTWAAFPVPSVEPNIIYSLP